MSPRAWRSSSSPAVSPPDPFFRPEALLLALSDRDVRVVVVGAFAAQIRGVGGVLTRDLDLTPDLERHNLQALAEVLTGLGATVRIRNHQLGPVDLPPDGVLLARTPILNLHLAAIGDVDVIHQVANPTRDRAALTYELLVGGATLEAVPGTEVTALVMSEQDWLDAKRTPPVREKDLLHIQAYERWRGTRPG